MKVKVKNKVFENKIEILITVENANELLDLYHRSDMSENDIKKSALENGTPLCTDGTPYNSDHTLFNELSKLVDDYYDRSK